MYFPLTINGWVHFQFQGCWVVFFIFIQILKKLLLANSGETYQTPPFVASDLVLHCLPMSHKYNARLIWINVYFGLQCFSLFISRCLWSEGNNQTSQLGSNDQSKVGCPGHMCFDGFRYKRIYGDTGKTCTRIQRPQIVTMDIRIYITQCDFKDSVTNMCLLGNTTCIVNFNTKGKRLCDVYSHKVMLNTNNNALVYVGEPL